MIQPPIVVNNFGDIRMFNSIQDVCGYLEPCDVIDNEYVAYDSAGRLLNLMVRSEGIHIEATEELPTHTDELRILLGSFLRKVSASGISEQSTLADMVDAFVKLEASWLSTS